jgi:hypothetical protein
MTDILCLSFVTGAVAFAVTETRLFRPVREWATGKNAFWGDLCSCGYCISHWVALVLVAIYQPRLLQRLWLLDYLLTVLIIAWLGGFQWVLMCLLMSKAGK